jgi:16S rRNA processing protein RimM
MPDTRSTHPSQTRDGAAAEPNTMAQEEKVLLARIGAPHGVRGEVRIKAFTADPLSLADFGALTTEDGRSFRIERLRPAKEVVVAKLRGINDRDAAQALNGLDLYVSRDQLPEPDDEDDFYHADLIGLEAFDPDGAPLGTVVAVHNFGAGDILDVAPRRGLSLLIPFTKDAVPEIDLPAGRLVAVPPPDAPDEDPAETGPEQKA